MDDAFKLNELKSLILQKLHIRAITPGDCRRISIEISKTLNKNVSETTIKRLFGFAMARHNFSRFTLTTLFEYVDQVHLLENVPNDVFHTAKRSPREDLHLAASDLTTYTLQGIRNRSGLPYEMTISRKFAEHDFLEFLKNEQRFTVFIAHPGYGKTTLLSHLVEDLFYSGNPATKNSTVLFTTLDSLITEDGPFNLENDLKEQLGIPARENLVRYIEENYNDEDEKFVLVLDGFAEVILNREIKNQLFDGIINFICALEQSKSIKLVMSMRCTTWIRFYERMRHSAWLRSAWFQGNYFNLNDLSNVPPLTNKEVDQIIAKMNLPDLKEINPKLKAQLKFPFHIQLYYQLKEEDPNFNYYSNVTTYELISRFIQEKIYRSNYYTEKILFLKKIIKFTNYGKDGNAVAKDKLITELAPFKNAYTDLLAEGILMEERRFENFHPMEYVRFVHPNIFEYFLFIEILENFNLHINAAVFQHIKVEYDCNPARFILLQWAVRFLVKRGELNTLSFIFNLGLDNYEKNYLLLFIAENLKHRSNSHSDTLRLIKETDLHNTIIKELISFDFIDSCYKEAVSVLIDITDNDEHALIYHSILAIPDILSLDKMAILNRIRNLARYKHLSANWIIDPVDATNLVYEKILNGSVNSQDALTRILRIDAAANTHGLKKKTPDTNEAISYLFAFVINLFHGKQQFVPSIIQSIEHLHPHLFHQRSPFSIYLFNVLGIAKSRITPDAKTDQIERIMRHVYQHKYRYSLTKYAESLYLMLQAEQSRNRMEYSRAIELTEECIFIFKRNQLYANCLLSYNLLISIYAELKDHTKVDECKYERLCFMEEHDISRHLFALPKEVYS